MIWNGGIFLERRMKISNCILQMVGCALGWKWILNGVIHPVTNFWLSGSGGGFEESMVE